MLNLTEESIEQLFKNLLRRRCPHRPITFKPTKILLRKLKLSTRHRIRTNAHP